MFPISRKIYKTCCSILQILRVSIFYLYFDSREEITVCLPESVLVAIFSDGAASSLSSEANVLDRIVKIVLGDEIFFHVHLHEGIATDDFWWCDSTEDSGPAIFATAEESSVVL